MLASVRSSAHIARPLSRSASSIANKYALSAYKAALSKSPAALTTVQSELNAVSTSIKTVPALAAFVGNPTISAKDRNAGVQTLLNHASTNVAKKPEFSEITRNLFAILSENGRLGETEGVIEGFTELVNKYKGELEVVVTSSSPLPKDILSRLETSLKQSQAAQKAKTVKVVNKVNPSILGGIVVDFGEKSIDLSVASSVTKLNNLLRQSV